MEKSEDNQYLQSVCGDLLDIPPQEEFDTLEECVSKWDCFAVANFPNAIRALAARHGVKVGFHDWDCRQFVRYGSISEDLQKTAKRCHHLITIKMNLLPEIEKRLMGFRTFDVPEFSHNIILPGQLNALHMLTANWEYRAADIPYLFLVDYLPVATDKGVERNLTTVIRNRQLVWNFKYGGHNVTSLGHFQSMTEVVGRLTDIINRNFGDLTEYLTLFCIPASSLDKNEQRYREFSRELCRRTGMTDAFPYIAVYSERTPAHLGGERGCNYAVYRPFFQGRAVLLFDDVLTTGRSLAEAADILKGYGAVPVAACFIGRTVVNEKKTEKE